MKRMKITVVGARGIPGAEGGAEKNAEMVFPLLAKKHSVKMYTLERFSPVTHYRGIHVHPTKSIRVAKTDKLLCYFIAGIRSLFERPDVLHCQGLGSALLLPLYKLGARRVFVRYGSADYDLEKWSRLGKLGFKLCEWQLRWADGIIAVTPSFEEKLRSKGIKTPISVIPNALDDQVPRTDGDLEALESFGLTREGFVLSVGRITPQKDFETLIRAFDLYANEGGRSYKKLVIVGGDDGSGYLERISGIAQNEVVFTGRLERRTVNLLMRNCGLYVCSSIHEGMSNAVLEAIGNEAPLVLTDITENKDIPIGGHHFVEVRNQVDLAAKILEASLDRSSFVVDRRIFKEWPDIAADTEAFFQASAKRNEGA